jgi:hypothetical protein
MPRRKRPSPDQSFGDGQSAELGKNIHGVSAKIIEELRPKD